MTTSGALLVLGLVLVPSIGLAQQRGQPQERGPKQAIAGKVVEDSTHTPIAGATVSVLSLSGEALGGARSDSAGAFRVSLDSAGHYRLRVEQPGYRTVTSDSVSLDEDEVLTVELRLARQAIPLEPLVVTARVDRRITAFYERVRKSGWGHFLTRADIERRLGQRPSELIRLMPGVRIMSVAPCRTCLAENVLFLRGVGPGGSNQCAPTVYIDGMEVRQDALSPLDALLITDTLEGVEVYTEPATAPMEFAAAARNCGVVAFWTRPPTGKFSWKKLVIGFGIALGFFFLFMR